jgi:hypothetical protein
VAPCGTYPLHGHGRPMAHGVTKIWPQNVPPRPWPRLPAAKCHSSPSNSQQSMLLVACRYATTHNAQPKNKKTRGLRRPHRAAPTGPQPPPPPLAHSSAGPFAAGMTPLLLYPLRQCEV